MTKRALILAGVLLLVSTSAVLACACTAGDGSCSASTNCPGGCFAICGGGGCSSGCSGAPRQIATFSFSGQNVSASELQQRISDEVGVQFIFAAKKTDDHFTVDVENASASDLLTGLAKIGAAAMLDRKTGPEDKADSPFSRRFSLKAEKVPSETVSLLLGQIFGESVSIKNADPKGMLSLDLESVTLNELRTELPRISGIKVEPTKE